MTTNPNDPAAPFVTWRSPDGFSFKHMHPGLTKREHFAGLAMQGLLSGPDMNVEPQIVAKVSVRFADALIAELAKTEGGA